MLDIRTDYNSGAQPFLVRGPKANSVRRPSPTTPKIYLKYWNETKNDFNDYQRVALLFYYLGLKTCNCTASLKS